MFRGISTSSSELEDCSFNEFWRYQNRLKTEDANMKGVAIQPRQARVTSVASVNKSIGLYGQQKRQCLYDNQVPDTSGGILYLICAACHSTHLNW